MCAKYYENRSTFIKKLQRNKKVTVFLEHGAVPYPRHIAFEEDPDLPTTREGVRRKSLLIVEYGNIVRIRCRFLPSYFGLLLL